MTDDPDRRPGPPTLWGGWTSDDHAMVHEAFTHALTHGATWGWRGGLPGAWRTALAPMLQLWTKQAPALFDPATFAGQIVRGGVLACGDQGYGLGVAAASASSRAVVACPPEDRPAALPATLTAAVARAAETAWITACDLWTLPGGAHALATGPWLPTVSAPEARRSEWLVDPLTAQLYRLTQTVTDRGGVAWTRAYRGVRSPAPVLAPEDLSVVEALILESWATPQDQTVARRAAGQRVMG